MLQTSTKTTAAADLLDLLNDGAATLFSSIQKRRQAARNRDMLAGLSDEQLADAGIDRWSVHASRPSMAVEAGLMTNLMSMR